MKRSLGREKSESERPVLDQRDQPAPAKGSPPPPFIVVRRGGVHEWRHGSRRLPLNCGGTVVGHCRKRTVGRRRTSPSSWAPSLVSWRWRRPSCRVPAVVMAWDGPGPPGRSAGVHTRRSGGHVTSPNPFLSGRRVRKVGGSSTEPVLSRVAGPKALLQRSGWRSGDQSQRMGPRSHLLWEWRPDAARPLSRGGVAGF